MSIRLLVCGGRDYNNKEVLYKVLNAINNVHGIDLIISGAAKGTDSLAVQWATENNIEYKEFPADWNTNGKAAGPIRNAQMLSEGLPDLVVAFPGGKGTADMIKQAKKAKIKTLKVNT